MSRGACRLTTVCVALVLLGGCALTRPSPGGSAPSITASAGTPSAASPTPTTGTATATPSASPSGTPSASTSTPSPSSPSCDLPAGLLGRDLTVLPGGERVVALTFDAGGSDEGLASILATLSAYDAPATFFLTGRFATVFPAQARRIARAYPVGNHTQNHRDLTLLSPAAARSELAKAESTILSVTGVNPRPYFRFPLGARNDATIALVNARCYIPFRWTVDTLGWQGTGGGKGSGDVYRRVVEALRPGAIVLMHVGAHPEDGSTLDADALPRIIEKIREEGYRLTTLEEALPAAP